MTARTFVNLLALGLIGLAQVAMLRALTGWTASWPVRRRRLAIGGLWLVFAWTAAGLLLTVPGISRRAWSAGLRLPAPMVAWMGGAAYIWSFVSTCTAGVWIVTGWLTPRAIDPSRRRWLRSAASLVPAAVTGYGTFIGRTNFHVVEVDLPVVDLHRDLHNLRIAHLSDIHLSPFLSVAELERVVAAANEARPHVTVVTGDLISRLGDPLDEGLDRLAKLRSDAGVFGCHGNHEVYARCEEYTTEGGARRGLRFLRLEAEKLRFGAATLNIAGVDYQPGMHRENYLRGAAGLVVPGATNLLLSHNPDVLPTAARLGFEAMLAGHTHGGQVTFEILHQHLNVARLVTPYVYGIYRESRLSAYVTRGIGTIGIPVRLGATPELAVLRLIPASVA